jgi:hypothetical protein
MEIYKSPSLKNHKLPISIISILIVCLLFYEPVRTIFKKTVNPVEHKWDKEKYEIGHFLQDAVKGKHNLNNYTLIHEGYSTQNLFYLNILNKRGINISLKSITQLTSGEKIIVHQKDQKKILNELYYVKVDSSLNNIELLTIDSIR